MMVIMSKITPNINIISAEPIAMTSSSEVLFLWSVPLTEEEKCSHFKLTYNKMIIKNVAGNVMNINSQDFISNTPVVEVVSSL